MIIYKFRKKHNQVVYVMNINIMLNMLGPIAQA